MNSKNPANFKEKERENPMNPCQNYNIREGMFPLNEI